MSPETTSGLPEVQDNPNSVGAVLERVLKELSAVSNSQATDILKMVGAKYNVRFVPAFMPLAPQVQKSIRVADTRGQAPRYQPSANPEVKKIKSLIRSSNSQISKKSKEKGGATLDESDPLIVKRDQLFRELKALRNKTPQTFEEGFEAKAPRASVGGPSGPN